MAEKATKKGKQKNMEQTNSQKTGWGRLAMSRLKHPSQFSKPQLAIFVLAFALIGYLIFRTFAAAPVVATIEGEQMSPQVAAASSNDQLSQASPARVVLASTVIFKNLTLPALSGSTTVGSTLTAANGSWSPTPSSYKYNWFRCSSSGSGCSKSPTAANQRTYVIHSGDVGYTIKVQVAPNGEWSYSKDSPASALVTAAPVTKTFGQTAIGGSWTGGLNANDRFIQKFSLSDNAQVSKLTYYLKGDGTASQVAKAIIYADSNGSPTSLMGQGTEVTVTGGQAAGWVSFPFASPVNLTPGNYWIGLIRGDTAGTIDVATDKTGGTEGYAPDTYSDGATNPFGTVKGTSTYNLSGYATYTVGSSTPTASTKIVNDSTASNGQEIELLSNATVTSSFTLPSTAASMTVTAKADLCSGIGAAMTVKVDGSQLISTTVNGTSLTAYSANTNLAAGSHSLSISYTNDSSISTCDRNLYVDVTNFYGPAPAPTPPPTVALSASPTSVTAGQSATLTWNSTNATSCTASGGWTGSKATSGSTSTGSLNQNTTYSLTCTGSAGSATASATITVSAVTSGGGIPGIGVLSYGHLSSYSNLNQYAYVIGSAWSSGDIAKLETVSGKGLAYFAGSDVATTYSTGVPSSQASANGWLLYCGTVLCINKGFPSDYIGDIGSAGYQQAFITNVESYLSARPGIDGIFIDDTLYTPLGLTSSYPNKYPSVSTWAAAQVSFVKAVYSALHAKGYYVALNASGYIAGDSNSNTSANEQTWWKMVGPYSDGLMAEFYDETSSATGQLRATGTAWYQEWDSWQQIIPLIQSMGKDFIGLTKQSCTDTTAMTYGKASFLLEWNGGGGTYIYTCGSTDPYNTAWTKDAGKPAGAKVQVGVGWMRPYTKGTVLLNPSPTASQTFTVNGTSYTLGPTTARIL